MSLIKCLKKFGKGLSASDREALRNKFNEYQNAGFDNFKASMFALEDYHTQISNALNNLKSAVNIKQTDSTKPALLSFHQQGEDLTDFLTKLKTGGYSGVEVIRAKNEIQSLFEKPAQQEVKPESATKQETAYYNKKSGRQLIDEATPEQIAEALKLRESDPLEFYSRTFFHNLQEGDSFNIGQNEFLVKKGKGDARLIIQKTDINKKTTNISIFESPYGRYGTKGKDDAKFNQLARDIESQINFELTDNSDDLFSFVSHPTTKPFLDIAKRNEQHLLSKETKTTKQEQLEGLDLAEKYNIYPKESVESLYSRDNVPLSDILDAAIGYDDAYERINEIDNEIKGLDKKRDKQKIKALETEKHQIQWLVQSAQDAWGEDLLNKLFDIAEQSGFEVDREADRDLFAEFAMPYLTDGRYMENAYHKVNLRTYTNDLIGEFFATQEGERAFGVKAYEALQQVVDTEKNLPKSKEIAQAILDLSRDFGKVEAGEMVATDLIQVLNVVFSAENLSQPLNDARKQDNLTPPQREFYRWILEGTFKENLADIIKALQNEDVEYAPEQIQEPIVTEQNFTIYDIAKAIYQHFVGGGSFENINQARSFVQQLIGRKIEPGTNDAKMVDEVVELGVVLRAKQIAQSDLSVAEKYQALVNLYEKQPNLSVRTSTSTKDQAYSTPAPLAYIVSRLANINNLARVYEPSAGNGMLLMEANPTKAVVNELNSDRADNLISQGFRVSEMDAATKENPSEPFDVIIGNPPFGTVKNEYGVTSEWHIGGPYRTSQIDHAIIFQALKGLRQNGRAVFLLGGPSKIDTDEQRVSGYQTQAKRSFFHWLTTHYNLVDHFTIDGNLYKKQGAGFPIDVIVVRNDLRPGQKSTLGMPQANLPKIYRSWEDLAEKIGEQNETDFNGAIRTDGIGGQTNQLDAAGNLGTTAVGSDLGSTQSNTQPTTLFDLLSGQGSSNDSVGRRPGSGTRKPRRKTPRSESAGTDYSDSSEFGNDRTGDRGTSGGIRSDGGNAVTNAGQVQSSGSSNVSGNESGRLDGSTTNLDAVKEQNPDLTDDVIKGWTEAASDIFNILDDDTLLSIEDEKQPQTETQQNFSEKKYQALLPKFEQIWNAVKNEITNIQDGFKRFARFLVQSMKATREQILALRPYIARFTVEKGRELTLQNQKKLRVKHIRPEFTPEQLAGASQIPWLPQSKGNPMGTLIPANQYNSVVNALESLEEKVGDIDNYVAEKLNYLDENGKIPDEFFDKFFGGEQIDALALAIYNIENGAGFIIGDQTGIGKGRSQPLNAKLLTPTGWKTMRDIKVGDKVISADGSPTKVVQIYPQGEIEIFRVIFSDGSSTECSADHLWTTITRNARHTAKNNPHSIYGQYKTQTTKELSEKLHQIHSIPLVPDVEFETKEVPLDAYLVGVILGDGCIRKNSVQVVIAEKEMLATVEDALPPPIIAKKATSRDYHYDLCKPSREWKGMSRSSNPVINGLTELGLLEKKAVNKFIPDVYKFNSKTVRLSILQGLLDTDGTVNEQGSVVYYSISKQLADDVTFLVRSLGGVATQSIKKTTHNDCYVVFVKLPNSINPFRLSRKAERVKNWVKYHPQRVIRSIEFSRIAEAQCIEVEHKSHLYVTDDFILTHNCVAGVMKYALLNDHIPVFVTEKANLYKDIYRDLIAIGMNPTDIKPLMTDSQKLIPLTDYAIDTIQLHGNANPRSRHIRHLLNSGEILMSPEAKDHNPILRQIAENGGELPSDYNIVFATYYAFQSKKGETPKREFLKSIADKSIFIFDESHNAGGDGTTPRPRSDGSMPPPNRAQFARNLVEMARGVFYSSATWAKRPDVMSLYSKTDMRLAVNGDVNVLGGTIERGGVPLQQVVSAMLAETGQYMRRERDFDGINYDTTEAVIDKKLAENVSAVFRAVFEMSKYLEQEVIPEIGDDLMESAHVIRPGLGIDSNMVSNGFANVMHNAIAQMLLALKVKPAVEEALRDLRSTDENGRKKKVVLTVANTMGSLIAEYAEIHKLNPGDAIDLTFGNVLRRYLEKSRTVSIGAPNAGSERVTVPIPDSLITDEGMRLYNKAIATIEKYDWSQLPGSPIDWMISELEKEGFKVGEITGRSQAMMYNPDGSAIYRRRVQNEISIKGRNETIKGFNSGAIDVIILNQAGATGLSLHAAKEFSDQGQRVMILVQPEANIDTHMQMLGRVNRTGQIIVPHYKQLTADIPAEKRPAANLAMKMAKLNANTTASTDSAVTAKDTLDFLNKYGNEVVAQFLEDNRDVADRLGNPLREEDNGLTRQDAARKVTGRLPILTLAEQEDFFNNVSDIYNAMITQLKSIGEYDLEAQTFPLEAKTITRRKIFAGPGGSESPFAGDAYAEEVESKKLSRPRSSAEVTQILQDALQLDDSADNTQIKEKGWQTTMSLYNDWGKAIQEYIDSQMEDAYEKADGDDRITDAIRTRLNGLRGRLERALRIMPIGSTVEVKIGNSTYYGVVSAVRKMNRAKTPLALSDYQFTVLTTDASRQLIIPASQIYTEDYPAPSGNANAATIKQSQVQPGFMGISENIWNAFDNNSRTVTERRTIITGNLLAGYASFSAGKILYYTTDAGEIRQGILMPQDFNIEKELQEQPVRFTEGGQVREFLEGGNRVVNSLDGDIFISNYNNAFSVAVPSSRAKGAVYYQNQQLLDAANGVQFVSSGKNMYLRLKTDGQALEAVVNQLMNMGVKFETATFRDVARNIVGQQLPEVEVMQSESFELQQEIAEREKQLAEARAKFTAEKFNHTQSGKEVFVARPKNSRDASDYSVRRLASQHNGYYSSFNKDGAIAGFHFKNAEDRDAFIQSTSETENMLSVEDNEELKRQEAIRTVKTVPLAQVAVKTQAVRVGNRVKLNIAAMEMLRRAMEQVDIDEGKRDFREKTPYPAFLGMSPDVLKLHKAIAVLEKIAAQAEKREMHDVAKSLRDLAQTLKEATKKGQRGSTVLYVIDKKLPHELLHQALKIGSGWKIFDEQHTAEGRTKLDNSAQFKKADDFFFSKKPEYSIESYMAKGYSRSQAMQIRRGVIREEIAAWIAEGSWENIGLSKEEGFNYLLDFLQSFGQKVYNDNIDLGKTPQQALEAQNEAFQNFNEVDYAREIINYFHSRTNTTESGQVGRPDEASPGTAQGEQGGADEETGSDVSGYEPKTIVRPKGDASELEYPNQFPGVLKKYGLASLPGTQRAVGIAADNIVYTVFSDKAAQKEAQKLIQTLGVAGTLNLLLDDTALPNPDVHHAVAAFTLQKMLADESVRIQETNPEDAQKLMDIATNLGQKMALRMTKAGRFIRAASVIMKNVPGILATATSLYQQQHGIHADLPEAIKQRVQRIAEKSESDAVQAESLQKQLDILTAEVEKWKKELQLLQKGQGKNSRNNFVSRRKLVEAVKQRHKAEVGRALANLQNFTMNKPFPTVNFEGNTETTLLSIADNELPKEILQDFVKVGADLMVTGLAQSETMTPSEFKEQMISMFGNTIEPHLEQLHRESLTLRNRWLAEMNKEQKVKAIVREIGDDLSDEDIEAILQDDADKLYKRQAIVRLHHYLAYNSSKQKDISTLEEIIYGLAPNEITAFAASALVYYQPSAQEVYRLLEQESVTGAEAREVLREAVKIKERAEGIHKSKIENEKEIRREKISNGQQELEELKTLTSQAKRRSAESRLEIEKEFKRIGSNSYKIPKTEILIEPGYYWNIAKELYHTPWSLMTAGDLSGLGRQGGFLLIGRGMVNNLTNLFRKASGTLEKKGKATSQKGALVAFKNSARMEGQWMNDYLPQIVKNKFDQLAQRIGQIGFERTVEELEQHPYFELARQSEVDFALLGRLNEHSILKGEESLRANIFKMLADTTKDSKWHLVNPARAFSGLIEKSDEVYSLFLDAQRLLTFAQSAEMLMRDNYTNIETAPKEFKAIGHYINDATGRSYIGNKDSRLTNLIVNAPFGAPRYLISRFKLLYKSTLGLALPGLGWKARGIIAKDAAAFYGTFGALAFLASLAGVGTTFDPDDDDFLKFKIGSNHLDILGGLQQVARPMFRLLKVGLRTYLKYPRENINLFSEEKNDKGEVVGRSAYVQEGISDVWNLDYGVIPTFIRRRLHPTFSLPIDYWTQKDAIGRPFNWTEALTSRFLPLGLNDFGKQIYNYSQGTEPFYNIPLAGIGLVGLGYTQYPDKAELTKTAAEKLAQKINGMRFDSGADDAAADTLRRKLSDLKTRARQGANIEPELTAMVANGEISTDTKERTLKQLNDTLFNQQIRSMPEDGLKLVRSVANPQEQQIIDELLNKRARKQQATAEKTAAKERLGLPATSPARTPSDQKPLGEQLKTSDVSEALVLWEMNKDKLSAEQKVEFRRVLKGKVLNSYQRDNLTRERYDAAKTILGDELKFQFREPVKKNKVVKPSVLD